MSHRLLYSYLPSLPRKGWGRGGSSDGGTSPNWGHNRRSRRSRGMTTRPVGFRHPSCARLLGRRFRRAAWGLERAGRRAPGGREATNVPPPAVERAAPSTATARARPAPGAGREREEAVALGLIKRREFRAALAHLMTTQGDAVYDFCLYLVKDPDLAKDVLQRAFLDVHKGLPNFAGDSSLRTWILGIARHRALDALRSRRREAARVVPDDGLLGQATEASPDPSELAAGEQARGALERCLESCASPEERTLLWLRFREGRSYEEIGALLGEKPDTLRARVARLLPKLRRFLERMGFEP
jgi:RNA polymerase sigma factor (sigma-70 family)